MAIKILDTINNIFDNDFPIEADSMDGYIDQILDEVKQWGEDLREDEFYLGKAWMEFRDDEDFHDTVLHFFNDDGDYVKVTNGDAEKGSWSVHDGSNKMFLSGKNPDVDEELYDLAFLDDEFFILKKHGNQQKLGNTKYFFMVSESAGGDLEWLEAMDKLFNKYRNQSPLFLIIVLIVLLSIAILFMLF